MCGIAGAVSTAIGHDLNRLVQDIIASQTSRGPDATVVTDYDLASAKVCLGHNRLSIIDLSSDANQPMTTASGEITVVFNGEIYNYVELRAELESAGAVFRTQSDTEVLIEAYRIWGDQAFERFFGMFAIALIDHRSERLILVRDRFGVKPLYYWTDGRSLVFASTPKVIARFAGLRPNLAYVSRGLRFKYYDDDANTSPYEGLKALESGCRLAVAPGSTGLTLSHHRWYDLRARVADEQERQRGLGPAALEEILMQHLAEACRVRLRADVPLGVSLSGGVDSTTIAALVAPQHPNLVGYSFGSPMDPNSEAPLVQTLAAAAAITPRWVTAVGPAEVEQLFWATLAAQQAPFPHASIMAQFAVFQAARADGVKVLLGGQAGDEAFMGYRKFYLFYAQSVVRQRRVGEFPHLVRALAPFALAVAKRAPVFWTERRRYAARGEGMGTRLRLPELDGESMGMAAGDTPRERQILDLLRYSLPTLLRYEDRNSLGNSVESRLPFIDHRVVEFGVALSERLKLGDGFGKWILRKAMRGKVPDAIRLNRDKRGFDIDQDRWIDGGLGSVLREALGERRSAIEDYLPPGSQLPELFSDGALKRNPQAFREAVSLIWLGEPR